MDLPLNFLVWRASPAGSCRRQPVPLFARVQSSAPISRLARSEYFSETLRQCPCLWSLCIATLAHALIRPTRGKSRHSHDILSARCSCAVCDEPTIHGSMLAGPFTILARTSVMRQGPRHCTAAWHVVSEGTVTSGTGQRCTKVHVSVTWASQSYRATPSASNRQNRAIRHCVGN